MSEQSYVSPIPENAVEVIDKVYEDGSSERALYRVDGKDLGFRYWNPSGALVWEVGLKDGIYHGSFRRWYDNGQVEQDSSYIEGKEHGETKQYDPHGVQIGSYLMDYGTGLDLWFCSRGILSEERQYLNGERHGYERWWRCEWRDEKQMVWEESHFWHGVEHGIFRRWNKLGKLHRGYPQYFVNGKRLNKRHYVSVCRKDPTLPPFVADDNFPIRQLPTSRWIDENVRGAFCPIG